MHDCEYRATRDAYFVLSSTAERCNSWSIRPIPDDFAAPRILDWGNLLSKIRRGEGVHRICTLSSKYEGKLCAGPGSWVGGRWAMTATRLLPSCGNFIRRPMSAFPDLTTSSETISLSFSIVCGEAAKVLRTELDRTMYITKANYRRVVLVVWLRTQQRQHSNFIVSFGDISGPDTCNIIYTVSLLFELRTMFQPVHLNWFRN